MINIKLNLKKVMLLVLAFTACNSQASWSDWGRVFSFNKDSKVGIALQTYQPKVAIAAVATCVTVCALAALAWNKYKTLSVSKPKALEDEVPSIIQTDRMPSVAHKAESLGAAQGNTAEGLDQASCMAQSRSVIVGAHAFKKPLSKADKDLLILQKQTAREEVMKKIATYDSCKGELFFDSCGSELEVAKGPRVYIEPTVPELTVVKNIGHQSVSPKKQALSCAECVAQVSISNLDNAFAAEGVVDSIGDQSVVNQDLCLTENARSIIDNDNYGLCLSDGSDSDESYSDGYLGDDDSKQLIDYDNGYIYDLEADDRGIINKIKVYKVNREKDKEIICDKSMRSYQIKIDQVRSIKMSSYNEETGVAIVLVNENQDVILT